MNNLREVVFHSLRHSSATYKLKLSKGDIKATQGDTGHKSADMHILLMKIEKLTLQNLKMNSTLLKKMRKKMMHQNWWIY